MLDRAITLPLWAALPLAILALLGAKAFVIDPIARRTLIQREKDAKARLNTTLSRPLPKVLQVPRRVLTERLLNDSEVQRAIDEFRDFPDRDAAEKAARAYVDEIMPSFFALFYFHIGYWLARRWLRSMYDIRVTQQPPPEFYAHIPEDASIVLVGNHRSNIDVAMLSYLAARTSMISFAAGEWAAVWPVNRIMQMSGCYIIRRDSQGPLYKTVLARYLRMMIGAQMPQGIFLEGGLSRDGAIQPIKLGLLRYILAGLGQGGTRDVVFIPVAFNYDRVPEDTTLITHQDEGFTRKSKLYTVTSTLRHSAEVVARLLRLRRKRFGQAAVSFGPDISARAWLEARGQTVEGLDDAGRKAMVAPMAQTIIDQISDMVPVLPVSLVAQAVCTAQGPKMHRKELQRAVAQLLDQLRARNVPIAIDEADDYLAFERGAEVLQTRKVLLRNGLIYSVNEKQTALLTYYARTISHHIDPASDPTGLRSILMVGDPAARTSTRNGGQR